MPEPTRLLPDTVVGQKDEVRRYRIRITASENGAGLRIRPYVQSANDGTWVKIADWTHPESDANALRLHLFKQGWDVDTIPTPPGVTAAKPVDWRSILATNTAQRRAAKQAHDELTTAQQQLVDDVPAAGEPGHVAKTEIARICGFRRDWVYKLARKAGDPPRS